MRLSGHKKQPRSIKQVLDAWVSRPDPMKFPSPMIESMEPRVMLSADIHVIQSQWLTDGSSIAVGTIAQAPAEGKHQGTQQLVLARFDPEGELLGKAIPLGSAVPTDDRLGKQSTIFKHVTSEWGDYDEYTPGPYYSVSSSSFNIQGFILVPGTNAVALLWTVDKESVANKTTLGQKHPPSDGMPAYQDPPSYEAIQSANHSASIALVDGITGKVITNKLLGSSVSRPDDPYSPAFSFSTSANLPGAVVVENSYKGTSQLYYALGVDILGSRTIYESTPASQKKVLDEHGQAWTFNLTGPGSLVIGRDSSNHIFEMSFTGTTTATSLVVTGPNASAVLEVDGNIFIDGSFGAFTAGNVNLTESFFSDGLVKSLALNDLTGGDGHIISLGGSETSKTALAFGRLLDVSIQMNSTLSSFKALEWVDSDSTPDKLTAYSLAGAFSITGSTAKTNLSSGNFEADIQLTHFIYFTGQKVPAISSIDVKGALLGNLELGAHTLGSLKVGSSFSGNLEITGDDQDKTVALGSVTIAGALAGGTWNILGKTGALTFGSIGEATKITVSGDIASFTSKGTVGGLVLLSTGNIGAVTSPDWNGGAITAKKIASITTKSQGKASTVNYTEGNFRGTVTVNGDGKDSTVDLGPVTIAGVFLESNFTVYGKVAALNFSVVQGVSKIDVVGDIASLTSKQSVAGLVVIASGNIGAVSSLDWIGGSITAKKITSITTKTQGKLGVGGFIAGDFSAAVTLLGDDSNKGNVLTSAVIVGTLLDSIWRFNGNSGAISVGAINNSSVFLGVSSEAPASILPVSGVKFTNEATVLAGFTVTGKAVANPNSEPTFINSRIAAGTFTSISIKQVDTTQSTNNGFAAATKIGAYSRLNGSATVKVKATTVAKVHDAAIGSGVAGYRLEILPSQIYTDREFTTDSGDKVTVSLAGDGNIDVIATGEAGSRVFHVTAKNTNSGSSLFVFSSDYTSVLTSLADITIEGSIDSLNLSESSGVAVTVNGDLRSLNAGGVTQDLRLQVNGTINMILAPTMLNTDISADQIDMIVISGQLATSYTSAIAGDFSGNVTITGEDVPSVFNALGSAEINGTLMDSTWNVNGNSGAITVGAIKNSSIFVGVSSEVSALTLPGSSSEFTLPGATLARFTVTGKTTATPNATPTFINSRIAAGILTSITLKVVDLDELSLNGFAAAAKIGYYTRQTGLLGANWGEVVSQVVPGVYDTAGGYRLQILPLI